MSHPPIIEIDVHGLTVDQAIARIEAQIKKSDSSTYRIRVIHGYNRGNNIQQGIYREIGHGLNPKVLRIVGGNNPGITELILREYRCEVSDEYRRACDEVNAWKTMMFELQGRVLEAAEQENLLSTRQENSVLSKQLETFMGKYGYRDGRGWWVKKE